MANDPVDDIDGLNSAADVSKTETRAELKAVVRVFANADAVRAVDLSGRTRIIVGDNLYKKDTGSTAEDDGLNVIHDDAGNHWVLISALGTGKRKTVRVATTVNGTLATAFENGDTVDGVVLATGNLILVKNQTDKSKNGIRVVAASGAPARHADFDTYDDHAGALIAVSEGTANEKTVWFCSANVGGTLDTTDIEFTEISVTSDVPGEPGDDGADGTDPGILLTFDVDTADSDQGSGKVWLDNATLTSATVLYISKTNRAGSNIEAKLARLDDSSNPSPKAEGILTRTSDGAQLTFAMGAVTDATDYVKIAISGVAGAASFTAADAISFQAERIGDQGAAGSGLANVVEDTTPQAGGIWDMNGHQFRWSKGADVASASALTLGDDGNYFDITGTTAITSIVTKAVGTVVKLHFDNVLTLTHHATDLILPGGVNITTAAGDEAEFVEYATGDWRCTIYTKADGSPITGGGGGDVTQAELDAVHFDQRVQAMHLAEALGDVLFLGPDGSALHDGYDVSDYIDLAGSTAVDTSEAGKLKRSSSAGGPIAGGTGTAFGDMTANGGPANFYDGTTSKTTSTAGGKASATTAYTGKNYSASPKRISKVTLYSTTNNDYVGAINPNVTVTLYGKNGGAPASDTDGTSLGTLGPFADGTSQSVDDINSSDTSTQWDYVWVYITHDGAANGIFLAQVVFTEAAVSGDLVVKSQTIPAAAQPDWMRAAVRFEDPDGVTLNTDVIIAFSRDNGTTWTNATTVEVYTQPGDIRVLDTGEVDITAQPAGTNLRYRITTDNGIDGKFLSVAVWGGED